MSSASHHVGHVFFMGAWPQMSGLTTDRTITRMKNEMAVRDGSDEDFVGGSVGEQPLLLVPLLGDEIAISAADCGPGPVPAPLSGGRCRGRFTGHAGSEDFCRGASISAVMSVAARKGVTQSLPFAVMPAAPASGQNGCSPTDRARFHCSSVAKGGVDLGFSPK